MHSVVFLLSFLFVMQSHGEFHQLSKKIGDEFEIEFPSNPSTGYRWQIRENPHTNEDRLNFITS
jgi:predicted secreted protein